MTGILTQLKHVLTTEKSKTRILTVIKTIFFIVVAIFLIQHLPEFFSSVSMLSVASISSVLFLQLFTLVLVAYQWHLCSRVFEHRSPGGMRDFWIINSYGTLLEGVTPAAKTGGEGLKAIMITRKLKYTKEEAILLVACHKILSISSFFAVLAFFYFGLFMAIPDFLVDTPVLITVVSTLILIILLCYLVFNFKNRLEELNPESKLLITIEKTGYFIKLFWKHKLSVSGAFLIGLMIWFLLGVKAYLISVDLEIELSFFQVSTAAFIGYLFGMIPVSPGGLGTFEGAMMVQLLRMGLARGPALSLSILSRLGTFWFTMLISFISVCLVQLASGKKSWWKMNG